MKIPHLLIVACLFCISLSCSKNNSLLPLWPAPTPKDTIPKLPPITTLGKMTFGCLINGEVVVNKAFGVAFLIGEYNPNGNLYIFGSNNWRVDSYYDILLGFRNISDTGLYKFENVVESNTEVTRMTILPDKEISINYRYLDSGYLHIIYLNEDKGIFSGQFSFNAKNDSGQVVRIRDGRFDVRYKF